MTNDDKPSCGTRSACPDETSPDQAGIASLNDQLGALYKEKKVDADAWFMCPKCGRLGQRMEEASHRQVLTANAKTFGSWCPVDASKPDTFESVIVWGVLEGERQADSHEGQWNGKLWKSVRDDEMANIESLRKLDIAATHWMPRPRGPNAAGQTPRTTSHE